MNEQRRVATASLPKTLAVTRLRRGLLRRLSGLALLAGLLVACQGSGTVEADGLALAQAAAWRIDLVVQQDRVLVVGLGSALPQAGRTLFHGPTLAWELRAFDAELLAEGVVADPRTAHAEWTEGDQMQRRDLRTDAGVVRLQIPPRQGELSLFEQAANGRQLLGRVSVDAALTVGRLRSALLDGDSDVLGPAVSVLQQTTAETGLDLLFVPEGFTESELDMFHAFVDYTVEGMREIPAMAANWQRVNIWRQDVRSNESGIDDPQAGLEVDTAFDASFGETVRRCVFTHSAMARAKLAQLAEAAQADQVILIANSTESGACATSTLIVQTRTAAAPSVAVHEMGHSVFDLEDEYSYGSCNAEAVGKNISRSAQRSDLPWSDLVTTDELPTAYGSAWQETVGAYKGARYCAEGMYRPQHNCRMRTNFDPFCRVCAREVERYFSALPPPVCAGDGCVPVDEDCSAADALCPPPPDDCAANDPSCQPPDACPESLRDDGSCDACLGDDPDCAAPPDPCPESLRDDGYCDLCLEHDADCTYCPEEWWGDNWCDACLRGDPDCLSEEETEP